MVDYPLKIATVGQTGVGKTKIIMRYINDKFIDSGLSTIGIDCFRKIISYKNKNIKLNIYDTSGQEKYESVVSNYYKNSNGIILVYDITSKKSYDKINYWIQEIKDNSWYNINTFILIGNKSDLESEREVSFDEGKALADKYGITFLEGSAKTGENVNELFETLVQQIIKNNSDFSSSLSQLNFNSFPLSKEIKNKKIKKKSDVEEKESCC